MADPDTTTKNLSHRLTADIRRDIVAGVFPPGVRLKTDELARRYGVSSNPVREALWRLQGEGFVVQTPNLGAHVRVVDDDFVRNIFEIREAVEPLFARRMCLHAAPADIERLSAAQEAFAEAAAQPEIEFHRMDALNRAFHGVIMEHETNLEALQVIERYGDLLTTVRSKLNVTRGRSLARAGEHAAITRAIRSGDPDLAYREAANHVRQAGQDFLDQMRFERTRRPARG